MAELLTRLHIRQTKSRSRHPNDNALVETKNGFPTVATDETGKQQRMYHTYQPPYEALKGITGGHKFLKPGVTFADLDKIAYRDSDNEFVAVMRQRQTKLFDKIRELTKMR